MCVDNYFLLLGPSDSSVGKVGYFRFCRRQDVNPASLNSCGWEEIPGETPRAGDVVAICKRSMGDAVPFRSIVLVPQDMASRISYLHDIEVFYFIGRDSSLN